MEGKIVKGIAGFYYVDVGDTVYECKARGKFRKEQLSPLIGDRVKISVTEYEGSEKGDYLQGSIEEILPRKNKLLRPPVANVDQGLIVFSVSYPQMHLDLLDRFLVMMEMENIKAHIVLNKIDDVDTNEYQPIVDGYTLSGYDVYCVSAKAGTNIEQLRELLRGKTSFFAGPSGVGKSTLLNTISPNLQLQTGEVSTKIKRGKHTTRHVELLPFEDGYVLDTPGFTSLQFEEIDADLLKNYFAEFEQYVDGCKYKGCNHIHEPSCRVKDAVSEGEIYSTRYNNYVSYYNQLKNVRKW